MLRALLWLVVLAGAAYIGHGYASPYLRAWRFKDAMTQTARLAHVNERDEMRDALLESAADLGVPLEPRRLEIRGLERGDVRISAAWEEIVTVQAWKLGRWADTLRFAYEVEDPTP